MVLDRLLELASGMVLVALVRGLAVFAVALAVALLARRLTNEARHLIWFAVVLAFLLLPLAWLAFPSVSVGKVIPVVPAAGTRLAAAPLLSRGEYTRLIERSIDQALVSKQDPAWPLRWLALAAGCGWLAGVVLLSVRFAAGHARVLRLAGTAREDRRLAALAASLARGIPPQRLPLVMLSTRCRMPFSFGVRRPRIMLPANASRWSEQRAGAVLTHELAHVSRRDLAVQSIAYAACVLCWFIPPIWVAYVAMLREAEACCDQQVINAGFGGTAYARDIVDLVRGSRGRMLVPVPTAALAKKHAVLERVEQVLQLEPGRRPLSALATAGVVLVCLACMAPLLAVSGAPRPLQLPPDDPFFGTWVNPALEQNEWACAKGVVTPDGHELDYHRLADTEPAFEVIYTFEEVWEDGNGDRWYRGYCNNRVYPSGEGQMVYILYRINAGGTVLEGSSAQTGYPPTIDPVMSPCYFISYKQP